MPLDFPSGPAINDTWTGSNGVTYTWTGTMWTVSGSGSGTAYLPLAGGPTYADNSGFSVNQRGYVSGAALAAGIYGHDRWKAGAGGCTYTFTQSGGPATTVTITAGTLQQVVEGLSVVGGSYMLSWTGTAQGRVGAGSYAASPVAVTGIVAGANTTIEFNAGTLGQVKLEVGTAVTPWLARDAANELANCQRFYQVIKGYTYGGYAGQTAPAMWFAVPFPVPMRAAATMIVNQTAAAAGTTVSASGASATVGSFYLNTSTAALTVWTTMDFTAAADL